MKKQKLSLRVASVLALFILLVPMNVNAQYLRGDVDEDGKVNIQDVTSLIDYLLRGTWEEEPIETQTETIMVNGIPIVMVRVDGGTFTMGASGTDGAAANDEYPAHQVTLSSYWMCTTEVTQQLYRAVMGSNPSTNTGNTYPVESLTYSECLSFITRLNAMTGKVFRLPTEAEWEFASRGGNNSKGYRYAGSDTANVVGWYYYNSLYSYSNKRYEHVVALKKPNELGLYDMNGNVYEWCSDWYGAYSYTAQTNPKGPSSGTYRVIRGGNYNSYGSTEAICNDFRHSYRSKLDPTSKGSQYGMRLTATSL